MAIKYENMRICLTEETAKSFINKLKTFNPEISKKRDMFINQSKENIRIEKTNNSTIIIKDKK